MHGGMSTGPKTLEGRARSLANLVQFRDRPEDIDAQLVSPVEKRDPFVDLLELNQPGKAPLCRCGCTRRVTRRVDGRGWTMYATPSCKWRRWRNRQWAQIWANQRALHRVVVADAKRF